MLFLVAKPKRRAYLAALLTSIFVVPSAAAVSDQLANASSTGPTTVVLEAEDAMHNLGIGSGAGASGRGALGYWLNAGGFARFTLTAPQAGTYRVSMRHASAWDLPSTRTVVVDGRDTGRITFPSTGGWGSWTITTMSLPLSVGAHTFELAFGASDWGAVDLDNITISLDAATDASAIPATIAPPTVAPETTTPPPTTQQTPLEWSTGIAATTASAPAVPILLEAEDFPNNLVLETVHGGTGRGSLGYWSAGGFVQFTVNAPASGTYLFRVKHSSAWDAPSTRTVLVDGSPTQQVSFLSTGAWGAWRTTDVAIPLTAGGHTLQLLYASGDWGALNIDSATFEPSVTPNPTTSTTTAPAATTTAPTTAVPTTTAPTTVTSTTPPATGFSLVREAENAAHNIVVETVDGSTGGASLGYWMSTGGYVRFTVTVPVTASYRLRARHASAWDADATRTLLIDGATASRVVFPSSGAWDRWRTTDALAQLSAGTHTIEFRFGSSDTGALNLDNLAIDSLVNAITPVTLPATTTAPSTTAPTTIAPATTTAVATTSAPTTAAPTTSVAPVTTTTRPTVTTTPSVLLEAEDAAHNLVLETAWNGTGRGSLGYWSAGGFVRFAVSAPTSGTYRFRVKHSSAWDAASTRSVLVDGARTAQVTFPSTGGWGSWVTTDLSLPLGSGMHTVELAYASGDWGAVNIDNATVSLISAGAIPPTTTTPAPTTTTAPTTTAPPAPTGGVVAGDARMCAGPGSQAVVATILNNQRDSLRGQAGGGVYGMEGVYSVLLNPLEMAINCNNPQMLDSMAYIMMGSESTMSTTNNGRVWLENGAEIRLVSAEWIFLLSRVITGISATPVSQRTPNMVAVTQTFVPVVAAHINRWAFNTQWYGLSDCPYLPAYGHAGYVALLATKTIGGVKSFCNGLIGTDLLIMGAGSELLRSAANDRALVKLSALGVDEASLAAYVRASGALVRARLIPTALTRPNGSPAQGLDLDPGIYSDMFSEAGYSAYTGTTFPTAANVGTSPRAGWDTSHLRLFVHLVNSLYRSRNVAASSFPTDGEITSLANQVAYGMLVNGNSLWPQFSNYFSGWNGWYRVDYAGQAGFGYGPSDLGNTAFMTGAYGLWAAWNPDLAAINARLGVILQATDSTTVNWRTNTYAKYWTNYVRSGTPSLDRTSSWFLLQHVAASVGAAW